MDELLNGVMSALSGGPSTIVEISEKTSRDSSQTAAILDYYVSHGDIMKTSRKFGSSPIYFLPKDKEAALKKLYDTLNTREKALVDKMKASHIVKNEDLTPVERYTAQSLEDFIKHVLAQDRDTKEQVDYVFYYQLSEEDIKRLINGPSLEPEKIGVATPARIQARQKKQKTMASINEIEAIEKCGFTSPSRLEKGIYTAKYGNYGLNVVILIMAKSSITNSDITKAAGYASENKTISFIITNANKVMPLSKSGNIVNIIKIQ